MQQKIGLALMLPIEPPESESAFVIWLDELILSFGLAVAITITQAIRWVTDLFALDFQGLRLSVDGA